MYSKLSVVTPSACPYSTVKIEIVFTVKNKMAHYLHLRLHGKGNRPSPCLELADGTGLTYCCLYAVQGDDGARGKKEKRYITECIVLKAATPLVLQSDGISKCSAQISTKLCMILYISKVLAFVQGIPILSWRS